MTATYWNGEETFAERGTGIVADANFPMYWARHLVGERIAVVRVVYGVQEFYLDDRDGQGWHKVTEGGGSPRLGHRNVGLEPGSFESEVAS